MHSPTLHLHHSWLQVYNVAGDRFVTFDGIAKACAQAMGVPEPELIHYNPKDFDFGAWFISLMRGMPVRKGAGPSPCSGA